MIIDKKLLDEISKKAGQSERLRMNYNFHPSPSSLSQRLLNALELGTSVPLHRHRATGETYIVLRGALKVFFYDDSHHLLESFILDPSQGVYGLDIPAGQWHSLEVTQPETVIFEAKDGPYTPLEGGDIRP